MLKASISKDNGTTVTATGPVSEVMADVIVMMTALYNQLLAADEDAAEAFRNGLSNIIKDKNGPMWQPINGQKGIIFPKNN